MSISFEEFYRGPTPGFDRGSAPAPPGSLAFLRSRDEWITLAILVVALAAVISSVEDANWVREMPSLTAACFGGLAAGWVASQLPLRAAGAVPAALAAGALFVTGLLLDTLRLSDPAGPTGLAIRWSEMKLRRRALGRGPRGGRDLQRPAPVRRHAGGARVADRLFQRLVRRALAQRLGGAAAARRAAADQHRLPPRPARLRLRRLPLRQRPPHHAAARGARALRLGKRRHHPPRRPPDGGAAHVELGGPGAAHRRLAGPDRQQHRPDRRPLGGAHRARHRSRRADGTPLRGRGIAAGLAAPSLRRRAAAEGTRAARPGPPAGGGGAR